MEQEGGVGGGGGVGVGVRDRVWVGVGDAGSSLRQGFGRRGHPLLCMGKK